MPTVYIVATPIGNLEDITLRALRTLKEVDLILCEDTRVTKKLLSHYDIKTPTMSYHAHSTLARVDSIFEILREGKSCALVSDAGTPTISDPGVLLVSQIRDTLGDDVNIVAVPGPSALVAALSVSGISSAHFTFYGFLPHKKGRETIFKRIAESKETSVFYESPHRIVRTLESLEKVLDERRVVAVARELTKVYESVIKGTVKEVGERFAKEPETVRGEFVVIVEGAV